MNITKYCTIIASLLFAFGCTETSEEPEKEKENLEGQVTLSADRTIIRSDGKTTDITDKAEIYFSKTDRLMEGSRFSTTESGEYFFYAAYGLKLSEEVHISALSVIPEVPADPQENGTIGRQIIARLWRLSQKPTTKATMTSLTAWCAK